jgi:chromosome segregation ATPase
LGDYARAVKRTKSPEKNSGKVYDNDNLPNSSSLSVVGQTPAADAEQDKDKDPGSQAKEGDKTADGKTADEKSETDKKGDKAQLKAGQAAEERQKALAAWKAKLDEQKSQVSLLTRELDVLQREHDIKATEFNGDTARRVQNPSGFAAEDAKYKKQIAEKQKAVDAAKGKLSEMQEEARKSGAPNSVAE